MNVPPALLIRLLREHRSEWADFNIDAYSASALKASSFAVSRDEAHEISFNIYIMHHSPIPTPPLASPFSHVVTLQMLEVIRLEGHSLAQEDAFVSRDIHLLQICSRIDEKACSELAFAPIDDMFPNDAPLLSSGFCTSLLDTKPVELNVLHLDLLQFDKLMPQFVHPMFKWALWSSISLECDTQDTLTAHRTLDLTSSLEVGPATNSASGDASSSYNARFRDFFCAKGCDGHISITIEPTVGPKLSPSFPEALTLAHWIC
ncbi:homeobox-leucine zipper family protein [Actinidia rufa]|uniref:Homeobox-leucine zipper family protein n=1 Tax=Actinidia rufa TaxID=165716 RepID=A0A7J0E9K7_9ERIC|nr:homeobox-leucine zipper family protein [Actinidia rufa]